jgi:hypothetical protein
LGALAPRLKISSAQLERAATLVGLLGLFAVNIQVKQYKKSLISISNKNAY